MLAIAMLIPVMMHAELAAGQPPPLRPPALGALFPGGAQIGVNVRDVDADTAERLKVSGGAVVNEVEPGSPAEKAGFQKGDIILDFDGERVRSARQLSRVVHESVPNRSVRTTILRAGQKTELTVNPEPQPSIGERLRDRVDRVVGARGRLGLALSDLTPQLADYFGAKRGVLVTAVTESSAAAQAGVKTADVIETVNGQEVRSPQDVLRAVRNLPRGGTLQLGIVRDKKQTMIDVKLDGA
jgi:S1-C subfamily serine protease